MIWMPGSSYQGALPVATDEIRDLEQKLHTHVHTLSTQIGERNLFHYDKLLLAAEYIRAEFKAAGYDALSQKFDVSGNICENIEAEVRGTDRREDILNCLAYAFDPKRGGFVVHAVEGDVIQGAVVVNETASAAPAPTSFRSVISAGAVTSRS